jgi:hypothetical protein
MSSCHFEVKFKEEDCDKLYPSSWWKFEFSNYKLQTLILTTKTRGFLIPLWVSIRKLKVFNSINVGLQTKNFEYLNHNYFKFLAKNIVNFLDLGQKQSWESKKFKCPVKGGGEFFFQQLLSQRWSQGFMNLKLKVIYPFI